MSKRPLSRRAFLATAGVSVAAGYGLAHGAAGASRPNIVYVFSDEHRYQSMSFTEMPDVHTPTMARMAKEGVVFHHCISSYPVCSPYRAMLMTGRHPYQTGVTDNNIPLKDTEFTVGDAFRHAGYRTGYIGKWHLGGTRAEPFGFDLSLIWTNTNEHYDQSYCHPKGRDPVQPKGYNATLMTDQALDFMAENDAEEAPYFLMLSLNPPHWRFTDAPPDKMARYPEGSLPYRPNVCLEDKSDTGHISQRNGSPHYEGYHAHITAVDVELSRVLDAAAKASRDTIVIYTSDHGSMFGSHGVGSKRQPFEESIRVPFMAWCPGRIPAGAASDALFGTPDLMPTLCGLAGLPTPDSCVGADFSGHILHGHGPEPEAQLIMHIAKSAASGGETHPAPIFRGVRTARHTYAVNQEGPLYLFDNLEDPYQMHNLADDPEYASLRTELHAMLTTLLEQAEDPYLEA